MKDYKRKNSKYVYKHIVRIFFEKHNLNNSKIALVEHECGEPQNYMTYGNFFKKILSFSNFLNKNEEFNIPEKTYNEEMHNVMHSKFSIDVIVDILNETKLEWLCLDLDLVEGLLRRINELPHMKNLIILYGVTKQCMINSNNEKGKKKSNLKNKENLDNINNKKGSELSRTVRDVNLGPIQYDKEKLGKINPLKEKFNNCS
ncbi:acyl-CoA synthetase, putative [Plasmodium gaboni]|uniref:Acyl-CoA synthetase, putative n=1 Tax=Plasmodium gaboni TaxID=647221 RepID=A0ABY0KW63_9APIC|nr:acyl-CoA synthetase, putative [Plasmodium gaboni]